MNKTTRKYLRYIGQSILFWLVAFTLFGLFRYVGIDREDGIRVEPAFQESLKPYNILSLFALGGVLMGIAFGLIELFFDRIMFRRLRLGMVILLKMFAYFLMMNLIAAAIMELANQVFGISLDNRRGIWRRDMTFWVAIAYVILASLVFSFIKISNEKFGRGIFLKMLLGKYKKPTEEHRIFMFLDLKSSTAIAEQLGHFKYSQLIQDCFYDLNEIVPQYGAEIYQYVGDEAVLSWPYQKGLANNQCVRLFFGFQDLLQARQSYYEGKYGLVPQFKAGLHGGKLMVAEVGVVKKELAFHGDVINTSARIQSECNNYNVPILISQALVDALDTGSEFTHKSLGSVQLKGKNQEVNICTLVKT